MRYMWQDSEKYLLIVAQQAQTPRLFHLEEFFNPRLFQPPAYSGPKGKLEPGAGNEHFSLARGMILSETSDHLACRPEV